MWLTHSLSQGVIGSVDGEQRPHHVEGVWGGGHHSGPADRFLDFFQVGSLDFSVKFLYVETVVGQTKHTLGQLAEMTFLNSSSSKGSNDWHV